MDSKKYKKYLHYKVLLMLDATYSKDGYIWTQDGTPAHYCNNIQKYLERRLGSEGFWPKSIWPPSSPNLNPLDFSIWTLIQERACATPSPSVDVLKARVKADWAKLSKHYIRDCSIITWRRASRLRPVCLTSKMFLGQCFKCLIIGLPGQPHPGQLQQLFYFSKKYAQGLSGHPVYYVPIVQTHPLQVLSAHMYCSTEQLNYSDTIGAEKSAGISFNRAIMLVLTVSFHCAKNWHFKQRHLTCMYIVGALYNVSLDLDQCNARLYLEYTSMQK